MHWDLVKGMKWFTVVAVLLIGLPVVAAWCPVAEGRALERIRPHEDGSHFVGADSGDTFVAWGFNYDHDAPGRLLEDYWPGEWPTVVEDFQGVGAAVEVLDEDAVAGVVDSCVDVDAQPVDPPNDVADRLVAAAADVEPGLVPPAIDDLDPALLDSGPPVEVGQPGIHRDHLQVQVAAVRGIGGRIDGDL